MSLLFSYLESLDASKHVYPLKYLKQVSFDLSLARGLDYYTGMIFEVITSASAPPPPPSTVITTSTASKKKKPANPDEDISESVGVGSLCGGGRYDDLVGRFAGESRHIPCVGMSVGIERVFALLKAKHSESELRGSETQVYVMGVGNVSVEQRLGIVKQLWDAGIKVSSTWRLTADRIPLQG
jgi:histidyl-tRNA synthetase